MSTATRSAPAARAHILVAVKKLDAAKSRLAGALADADRAGLVLSMLLDTLSVVSSVDTVTGVTVVTPDPAVAHLARTEGAQVYIDPAAERSGHGPVPADPERHLNAALTAAAEYVRSQDRRVDVVALQADLPSLREGEFTEALAAAREGGRSLVVDHHGTGTSALFSCDPTIALDPRFGAGSARRHRESGARALNGRWPGLRTDVDTPGDLDAVRALGVGPATQAALEALVRPVRDR